MLADFLISYQAAFVDHSDNVTYYTRSIIRLYNSPMLTATEVIEFQIVMAETILKYTPHHKEVRVNVLNIIKLGE